MLDEDRVRHEAKGTRDYYRFLQKCLTTSWPGLEKKDVLHLSEDDCEEWAGRYSKKVSPTLFNNASAELRKILEIAVEEGIRSFNPALVRPKIEDAEFSGDLRCFCTH